MSLLLRLLRRRYPPLCFCGRRAVALQLCPAHYKLQARWATWHSHAHGLPVPGGMWYPVPPAAVVSARLTAAGARRGQAEVA